MMQTEVNTIQFPYGITCTVSCAYLEESSDSFCTGQLHNAVGYALVLACTVRQIPSLDHINYKKHKELLLELIFVCNELTKTRTRCSIYGTKSAKL